MIIINTGEYICKIISNPSYVAKNPNKGSIEYIKEFKIEDEFVLVAVRTTTKRCYVCTYFICYDREKERNIFKEADMLKNMYNNLKKRKKYVIIINTYNSNEKVLRAEQAAATHC